MADFPFDLDPGLLERLAPCLDAEGKIPRALDVLGPLAGRDVVLVDGGGGRMAGLLGSLGARLTTLDGAEEGGASTLGLPDASTDAVVGCWSVYRGADPDEIAEADRILRPGGRLLVLHEYGRDDVSTLLGPDRPEYADWSRRDGPFARAGFRLRVVHAWWTFGSPAEAAELLEACFGVAGAALAARLRRPRLSWNVVVYHRDRPGT